MIFVSKARMTSTVIDTGDFGRVREYVSRMAEVLSDFGIYPRDLSCSPYDSVALAIISKTFALSRAVLLLIENGFPDEAYGLSRSLVECSGALRYMTAVPGEQDERVMEFIVFGEKDKRYWLEQCRMHITDPVKLKGVEDYAAQIKLDTRFPNPKAALGHWSSFGTGFVWAVAQIDHPQDADTYKLERRKAQYAADYHATSQYVHCSERGTANYFHDPARIYTVPAHGAVVVDNTAPKALFVVCVHLHLVVRHALFGLKTDPPKEVDRLFTKVIDELKFIIQHRRPL